MADVTDRRYEKVRRFRGCRFSDRGQCKALNSEKREASLGRDQAQAGHNSGKTDWCGNEGRACRG